MLKKILTFAVVLMAAAATVAVVPKAAATVAAPTTATTGAAPRTAATTGAAPAKMSLMEKIIMFRFGFKKPPFTKSIPTNGGNPVPDESYSLQPEGRIVSLRYSFGGGMANDYRSFFLRVRNGETLLDAQINNYWSLAGRSPDGLEFNDRIVFAADLDELNILCEDCGVVNKPNESPQLWRPDGVFIRDGDPRADTLAVTWENGAKRTLSTDGCAFCMDIFFEALAFRVATAPAEGRVAALNLSKHDNKEYYRIRENNGKFDLVYKLPQDAPGNNNTISVDSADMDRLQDICAKYNFTEIQQSYRPIRACYHKDYPKPEYHMEVEWENRARLKTSTAFGGEDELWSFFRSLVG